MIVNVCAALVSAPPFAVPPLSCSCTVTTADPVTLVVVVYVRVPFGAIAGCTANSALLLLLTMKFNV